MRSQSGRLDWLLRPAPVSRGEHVVVLGDQPRQFFRAAAKKIGVAWQTAVGSDLALPEVPGPRPKSMRITNVYLEHVLTAAETDPVVAERFLKVIGMVDAPARLLSPSTMLRIANAKPHCREQHNRGEPTRAFGRRS